MVGEEGAGGGTWGVGSGGWGLGDGDWGMGDFFSARRSAVSSGDGFVVANLRLQFFARISAFLDLRGFPRFLYSPGFPNFRQFLAIPLFLSFPLLLEKRTCHKQDRRDRPEQQPSDAAKVQPEQCQRDQAEDQPDQRDEAAARLPAR